MEKGMRENYEEPIVEMIELDTDVIVTSCQDICTDDA